MIGWEKKDNIQFGSPELAAQDQRHAEVTAPLCCGSKMLVVGLPVEQCQCPVFPQNLFTTQKLDSDVKPPI